MWSLQSAKAEAEKRGRGKELVSWASELGPWPLASTADPWLVKLGTDYQRTYGHHLVNQLNGF